MMNIEPDIKFGNFTLSDDVYSTERLSSNMLEISAMLNEISSKTTDPSKTVLFYEDGHYEVLDIKGTLSCDDGIWDKHTLYNPDGLTAAYVGTAISCLGLGAFGRVSSLQQVYLPTVTVFDEHEGDGS